MNYIEQFTRSRRLIVTVFPIITLLLFTSCAGKNEFLSSSVVPAARGFVKVKKDKNKNYVIQLQVDYLAEAERLQPPKKTYVVWLVTDQDGTKNIGQLSSSTKALSTKLKASFESVSPHKPVRVFITAENDATISYPGLQTILSTDRIRY